MTAAYMVTVAVVAAAALCAVSASDPAASSTPAPAASPAPPSSASPAGAALPAADPTGLSPVGEQPPKAEEREDRAYLIELRRPARATPGRTHVQLHLVPPSLLRPPRAPPAVVSAVLRPVLPAPVVSAVSVPVPAAAAAASALAMLDGPALESQQHAVRAPANELHWRTPYHLGVHKPYSFVGHAAFTPTYAAPTPAASAYPVQQSALTGQIPAPAAAAPAPAAFPAQQQDFRFPQQLPAPAPAAPAQPYHFEDNYNSTSFPEAAAYRAPYAGGAGAGGRILGGSSRPAHYFARPTAAVPPPLAFHPQPAHAASAPAPVYPPHPPQPQPLYHHQHQQHQQPQHQLQPSASAPSPQYVPAATEPAPAQADFPAPSSSAATPEPARSRATLRQVLQEDCPDAERLGFCASPPRYPSHQVSLAIHRCRDLLNHLYVPVPESAARVNREVYSWSPNATASSAPSGPGACPSESARVLPGYARDAAGRWLVVVQAAGLVVQPAQVDVCRAPGLPCPALAKCSLTPLASAQGRRPLKAAKASNCEQRFTPHHVVTWDPDAPERCPKLSVVMLPTACTCRLPAES